MGGSPDLELMEQLVKKSLEINPEMRGGKRTAEVMEDLRKQAVGQSKSAPTAVSTAPKPSLTERRLSTMAFFFEQKQAEFQENLGEIAVKERELEKEKKELKVRFGDELTDFLALMSGGTETPESKEILRRYRSFVAALGLNEADILRVAKTRR